MDRRTRQEAENLINEFLKVSLRDATTQKSIYEYFDSLLEKHFQGFHSIILKSKLKTLVLDAFIYGIRSGVFYVKVREKNVKDEKE